MLTDKLTNVKPPSLRLERYRRSGDRLVLAPFHLTFRVAEPAGLAHRLRPSANGVTGQGLGVVSVANGAGNPVLYAVQPHRACPDGKPGELKVYKFAALSCEILCGQVCLSCL
jgi:hypothetical protein